MAQDKNGYPQANITTSPLVPEGTMYVGSSWTPTITGVSSWTPTAQGLRELVRKYEANMASQPYYFMHPKDYEAWRFQQRCDAESTPIYDEIHARNERAKIRLMVESMNTRNARVNEDFRQIAQVREDVGVAPGKPLLGEEYFPKES